MNFKVLDGIGQRFENNADEVTFLTRQEYFEIVTLVGKCMMYNNELIKSIIDILTYRLGFGFDKFTLKKMKYQIMNKEGVVEVVEPIVFTLFHKEKVVLIMEGGMSGNTLHDLVLLLDKLLTMNIINKGGQEPIDVTVTMPDGYIC